MRAVGLSPRTEARRLVWLIVFTIILPFVSNAQESLGNGWFRFELSGKTSEYYRTASSVLEADNPFSPSKYGPEKALDGTPATSWVEGGEGAGIGEYYVVGIKNVPEAVGFINGYAKNGDLFMKNHRVKELSARFYAGLNVGGFSTEKVVIYDARPISEARTVRLADTMGAQRVPLPFDRVEVRKKMDEFRRIGESEGWDFPQAEEMGVDGSEGLSVYYSYLLRLEIADVYRGTRWEDTCLAELWPDFGKAARVFEAEDGRSLIITTEDGIEIPTYSPPSAVLTLVETCSENEWAVVIEEPAYRGTGRVESEYALVHVPTGRDLTEEVFGESPVIGVEVLPTGFVEENGVVSVEYEDFVSGKTKMSRCLLYDE
jgi:hypothetical protein